MKKLKNWRNCLREKLTILVVDEHRFFLEGTLNLLKNLYPNAKLLTAQTVQEALEQIKTAQFELIVMDLMLPEKSSITAKSDTGIRLLQILMKNYPNLNIVVQSTYIKALVRISPEINIHRGGFVIINKNLSAQQMLTRVEWALQGLTHTKELKTVQNGLQPKPEWFNLLKLAFEEGLQDKIIAERMNISERTVRHYWTKIQEFLGVYPEEGKNIRIHTEMRAREEGLID